MINQTSPQSVPLRREEAESQSGRIGVAFATCLESLKGLSNKETQELLRALCGAKGMQAVFPQAVAHQQRSRDLVSRQRANGQPQTKSGAMPNPVNRDPQMVEFKTQLAAVTVEIKKASAALGGVLPSDNDLVIAKRSLEERMRVYRNSKNSEQAGVPSGASA